MDAFGSPTIQTDANTFSSLNNLPQLTSTNFQIFTPTGPVTCGTTCGTWNVETTLDVEWAHTVAPNANIALVLAADNSLTNLDIADFFAIETGWGNVISNSWGLGEAVLIAFAPSELTVENNLAQLAAALGQSAHFSSGDDGDFFIALGVTTVSMPASAPFATAIGGTSLFLNSNSKIKFQTGWGTNETRIADVTPNPPVIPPLNFGFIIGSGGGTSAAWAKPPYQSSLPGSARLVPDISYVGDPFTGVEIIFTDPSLNQQVIEVIGGTSLSCPMFSGLWAIANQAAGAPLGQAANVVYRLPPAAITDVKDISSTFNVAGTIFDPPNPPTVETAAALASPLQNTVNFVSALYNSPFSTRWFVLTFGTDSSLTTGTGWDNVTGLGTPNALPFVKAIAP